MKPEWVICPKCSEVIVLKGKVARTSARRAGRGVCGHGPLCTRPDCRKFPKSKAVTR